MSYQNYIFLIPLLPFLSFLLLGLFGRKSWRGTASYVATASLFFTTILSFLAAYRYFFVDGKMGGVYQKIVAAKMTWLQFSPSLSIDMGFLLDPISMMMIVVVSLI